MKFQASRALDTGKYIYILEIDDLDLMVKPSRMTQTAQGIAEQTNCVSDALFYLSELVSDIENEYKKKKK